MAESDFQSSVRKSTVAFAFHSLRSSLWGKPGCQVTRVLKQPAEVHTVKPPANSQNQPVKQQVSHCGRESSSLAGLQMTIALANVLTITSGDIQERTTQLSFSQIPKPQKL